METKDIRVVIIEDDETIRNGFEYLINASKGYQVVKTFPDVEKAFAGMPDPPPDVILLDIELPGTKGIDALPKLKQLFPATHILMLTVYDHENQVFQALGKGASGYLTKNDSTERILDAIREVTEGGAPMSMNIARMVIRSSDKKRNRDPRTDR